MHPYSTDSPANPKLLAYLAFAAVALSAAAGALLASLNSTLGWHLSGVSSMACFGLLYLLLDRWLWRRAWIRRVLLVPDLNGTWKCAGATVSQAGQATNRAWTGTLRIRQAWSRISVVLSTEQSRSHSIAASIYRDPAGGYRLIYHYENEPSPAEHDLARHSGLCRIVFDEKVTEAAGTYFTDRDRMTVGTMKFTRGGS